MSASLTSLHQVSWFGLVVLEAMFWERGWRFVIGVGVLPAVARLLTASRTQGVQEARRPIGRLSHLGGLHSHSTVPLLTGRSNKRPRKLWQCFSWICVNIASGKVKAVLESEAGFIPKRDQNRNPTGNTGGNWPCPSHPMHSHLRAIKHTQSTHWHVFEKLEWTGESRRKSRRTGETPN